MDDLLKSYMQLKILKFNTYTLLNVLELKFKHQTFRFQKSDLYGRIVDSI